MDSRKLANDFDSNDILDLEETGSNYLDDDTNIGFNVPKRLTDFNLGFSNETEYLNLHESLVTRFPEFEKPVFNFLKTSDTEKLNIAIDDLLDPSNSSPGLYDPVKDDLKNNLSNFFNLPDDQKNNILRTLEKREGLTQSSGWKQAAGIGTEVITGIGTDLATGALLNPATVTATSGLSVAAYAVINFGSGVAGNIAAQKVRGEKDIDVGEFLAAGLVDIFPFFGSTGKGVKGLAGAALQGGVTAVADQQIQKAINEQEFLTPKEALFSATFGAGLGTTFKGSIDSLQGLYTKYAGKSADEINKAITPTEINQVNKIVKQANELNTTGVDNVQSTKVDNIFRKYDEQTQDRISDALGLRRKVKPFKTNLEAGRGLRGSQGADELKKRLQLETNFKRANPEEVKSIQEFIDVIGDDMFSDVSLSLSNKIGAAGQFDFASSLITIRRKVVEGFEQGTGGGLDHVAVHELWHSLSRYLPKKDLIRYKKEFATAQSKYLKQFDKERAKFLKTTSKEELANLIYQRSDDPFARKPNITDKNFLRKANAYFERGKFTNENYRFKNIDEFFAENLADEFFNALEVGGRLNLAPTGTFKRISQEVSIFIQDLFDNLRARLGGPNSRKIFSDFVKRKNVKKYRRFALDQTNVDKVVEARKGKGKKKQNIGPDDQQPNQINFKQLGGNEEFIRKSVQDSQDEGVNRFVMTESDIREEAFELLENPDFKQHIEGIAADRKINPSGIDQFALAEQVARISRKNDINVQRFINVINVKNDVNAAKIVKDEFMAGIEEFDDWVRKSIPIRSDYGSGLYSMQMKTSGLSAEEFAKLPEAEKRKIIGQQSGVARIESDIELKRIEDFKNGINKAFEEYETTGDPKKLNELLNIFKRTKGDYSKTHNLVRFGLLGNLLNIDGNSPLRVLNEIFINAILSKPTTHEINAISAIGESLMLNLELYLDPMNIVNPKELQAAWKHTVGLLQGYNLAIKGAKESYMLESNYFNPGAEKLDYVDRFAISMDGDGIIANLVNGFGKNFVRQPYRFLSASDAAFHGFNINASAQSLALLKGLEKGLEGKELQDYANKMANVVVEAFSTRTGKVINKLPTQQAKEAAAIFKNVQEFSKEATFAEDLPEGAVKWLASGSAKYPVVKRIVPFVRTLKNLIHKQIKRTAVINALPGTGFYDDLTSGNPLTRKTARGRIFTSIGSAFLIYNFMNGMNKDETRVRLTGGGPANRKAWLAKWKTGWRPYSIGYPQYNEDGTLKRGKDGRVVVKYYSFTRVDPLSGYLMASTDLFEIYKYLEEGDQQSALEALGIAGVRNITDRLFFTGINDFADLLYNKGRSGRFLERTITSNIFYSGLQSDLKRVPGDLYDMGLLNWANVSPEQGLRWKLKLDSEVYKGDESLGPFESLKREASKKVLGYGDDLPPMREHITNNLVLYPKKAGLDLFNWVVESESQNHPVVSVLADMGQVLSEPDDMIGSYGGSLDYLNIEEMQLGDDAIPLNATQMSDLRYLVNTETIKDKSSPFYGLNIDQAMQLYMKTPHFKIHHDIVKKQKKPWKTAKDSVEQIMSGGDKMPGLREINKMYIELGEDRFLAQNPDILEKHTILNKLSRDRFNQTMQRSIQSVEF